MIAQHLCRILLTVIFRYHPQRGGTAVHLVELLIMGKAFNHNQLLFSESVSYGNHSITRDAIVCRLSQLLFVKSIIEISQLMEYVISLTLNGNLTFQECLIQGNVTYNSCLIDFL
ncbi:Uncharacterised protein [Segatella copri]|nr:Uncharacterised protein [Segatella copri]